MLKVKNNITWVGKVDWELRRFHGNEYSTHRGSSYNSYLIREDRVALIDTVWAPFASEYVANLEQVIDLKKIDFVIANHGEVDHSGSLPELMSRIPDVPVYCTANGVKSLKGQYHRDWNFKTVKTGDRLSLGAKELVFVEAPMLHWPDSMMCYLTGDNVLFSNDAFGQHYATSAMFNDAVDRDELYAECIKYYANILTPFSSLVTKKINEFLSLGLPLDMICTSHGVIWRDDPAQIVKQYLGWANAYREEQVTIVYDTMWNGTRLMAEAIADGLKEADAGLTVKLYNASNTDKNDIITEVFRSKAVGIGSPTINQGALSSIAALLDEIRGLKFREKKGFAFGAYGWSGESVKVINEGLKTAGFAVIGDGLKTLWRPDSTALAACVEYGRKVAESI
ncbi:MAG TPA: anaerobic nitric oxide reductase flavorubredoxin [Spirochaetota bacterium]|nr:anaerobic nitric oxide reductase flavorubredoxin [Spirochaetota bacterium]HOD14853.1 anaerobic nitric oxide reductase flavorubredoxin [Spirochaetota bacterium]HPG50985.1 anaerobic nitric oxide reductase flavorubredoxin [Spirochaetota bacterium]HPN10659.1 anaerobic nitric oxide reductase flavorubredoxin [Spirochaetota bacterium]